MLPLGVTHEDGSPYQSLSTHAGNPLLISLDWLVERGWLESTIWEQVEHSKNCLLYTSPSPRDATLSRMPSSA